MATKTCQRASRLILFDLTLDFVLSRECGEGTPKLGSLDICVGFLQNSRLLALGATGAKRYSEPSADLPRNYLLLRLRGGSLSAFLAK